MRVTYLISFSLLTLLATGCKKSEPEPEPYNDPFNCSQQYIFTGKVLDSLTGTPLEGVVVGYANNPISTTWWDTSNVDGSYTVKYDYNPCSKYPNNDISADPVYHLGASQGYYYSKDINVNEHPDGTIFTEDIYAVPYSQLAIHITGTTSGETLSIDGVRPYPDEQIDLGSAVDTTINCQILSNHTSSFNLYVNGVLHSTTPFLAGYGTTGILEIHYP